MTSQATGILIVGGGIAELAVYSLAALGVCRHWGHTLAEAAAGAALLPALLLSFLLQVAHLVGFPLIGAALRLAVLAGAIGLIRRHREQFHDVRRGLVRFTRQHPLAVSVLSVTLVTLAAAVVSAGGSGTRFILSGESPPAPLKPMLLVGAIMSRTIFPGAVLLPWLAYLAICLATYALARRYAWPPTAITVTLLVASMPRLVFLSVARGVEIIPAAASILFILMLYRTVERPDIKDLLLMAVVLVFSAPGGRMGLAFPVVGLALAGAVLYRRHGGRIWWDLVRSSPWPAIAAVLPLFVFSQGWLAAGQPWGADGPAPIWVYNTDGLTGAAANLVRYGMQTMDLTPPVEQALDWVLGFNWNGSRVWIHNHLLAAFVDPNALAVPFNPSAGDRATAWFGPLSGLLMLPSVGWALLRGPRRLKSLALALVAYLALVALIPAWQPGNVRYFTVFFVGGGFTTAFLLPPWRMTRRRRRFLQVSAAALLGYAISVIGRSM
jgi:hypothetical protein